MCFKVTRLTVGKGKTVGDEKDQKWTRQYYEVEAVIEAENQIELAKESIETLLDTWLKGELVNKPQEKEERLDFDKLFWEKKQGEKGEYEQTSEKANGNCDLWKQLKAKVKEHKGFWQNGGYKFWFHQQDENVIDRRKA